MTHPKPVPARRPDRAAEAARNMSGFTFTPLVQNPGADVEIWRCAKPGTGVWAFDIMVTRRGMAVVGDIDGLLFQAGYGIQWLADGGLDYVHSKLEPQCKQTEFDEERFLSHCVEFVREALRNADFEVADTPEDKRGADEFTWFRDEVMPAIASSHADFKALTLLRQANELLRDAGRVNDLPGAGEFFNGLAGEGIVAPDWYMDCRLDKPDEFLMVRLHMVKLAATAITELKHRAAQESECAAAPGKPAELAEVVGATGGGAPPAPQVRRARP